MSKIVFVATILLAVGLGYIVGWYFNSDNDVYHGPRAAEIVKNIYHDSKNDKYYRFEVQTFICPPSLRLCV